MKTCRKPVHDNHLCARNENHVGDCACHWGQVAQSHGRHTFKFVKRYRLADIQMLSFRCALCGVERGVGADFFKKGGRPHGQVPVR